MKNKWIKRLKKWENDNMNEDKDMCTYCAKWFPKNEMKCIEDPRLMYCHKCYPEVYAAYLNLPWNRKHAPLNE